MLTYTCAVAGGGARLGLRPSAVGLGVGAEPYCETVVERARASERRAERHAKSVTDWLDWLDFRFRYSCVLPRRQIHVMYVNDSFTVRWERLTSLATIE